MPMLPNSPRRAACERLAPVISTNVFRVAPAATLARWPRERDHFLAVSCKPNIEQINILNARHDQTGDRSPAFAQNRMAWDGTSVRGVR